MLPRHTSKPTNFTSIHISNDSEAKLGAGGQVVRAKAGAALLVGDVVYYTSTAETVNKSATAADYAAFAGVVVGGRATYDNAMHQADHVGLAAAAADEDVLVQINGIAWVDAGAALATIGASAMASAVTAGRLAAGTTAGQVLGKILSTASGAGEPVKLHISHR